MVLVWFWGVFEGVSGWFWGSFGVFLGLQPLLSPCRRRRVGGREEAEICIGHGRWQRGQRDATPSVPRGSPGTLALGWGVGAGERFRNSGRGCDTGTGEQQLPLPEQHLEGDFGALPWGSPNPRSLCRRSWEGKGLSRLLAVSPTPVTSPGGSRSPQRGFSPAAVGCVGSNLLPTPFPWQFQPHRAPAGCRCLPWSRARSCGFVSHEIPLGVCCFWVKSGFSSVPHPKTRHCQLLGFLLFQEKPIAASRARNAREGNIPSLSAPPEPFFPVGKHQNPWMSRCWGAERDRERDKSCGNCGAH